MIILIPAFEPGTSLPDVAAELARTAPDLRVLVVDDGSGPAFADVFRRARDAGAEVIGYGENLGKGHALKHGFRHVLARYPGQAVVTADSDGQHRVGDILRVAQRVDRGDERTMVLGGRRFAGDVPARSRFGNAVSRTAFALATGSAVNDTQTGLRGFPAGMLEWLLTVDGERFEYELAMLLECSSAGLRIDEIPIETVYLEHNASSHFRPVLDSMRVLRPLLVYVAASLASFLIDVVALQLIFLFAGSLFWSVVGARVISGTANFLANRRLVFGSRERRTLGRDAAKYAALAVAVLFSSYASLSVLTGLGVPLLLAKLITDATLYVIGFQVQRRLIFAPRRTGSDPAPDTAPDPGAGQPLYPLIRSRT
jgi:putative flippase GtrA